MDWIATPEGWLALVTLTALEVVLGIDNIIFISILTGKLPPQQQPSARTIGLILAMGTRIALLFSLTWLMGLTSPIFTVFSRELSGRDLILLAGGIFLLAKSTIEIHDNLEGEEDHHAASVRSSFGAVIFQVMLLDIVFSLDSVITAIGMVRELSIMVAAIVIAVGFMLWASGPISSFVERHPTVKVLALSFLILIGFALIADSLDLHIPKGYIYFAMAFSVCVEMLNLRIRKSRSPAKAAS